MADQAGFEIKGFIETSFLDWPGEVASVLFLSGCNFRCPFCHNHGLVLTPGAYPTLDWKEIKSRLKRFSGWLDGVVISGGEPTFSTGLLSLAGQIKSLGLKVKLDTNGSRPEMLAALLDAGLVDHVAMDVKGPLDEVSYARAAGRPGFLGRIKRSLDILATSGLPYTLRTTVTPILHSERDVFLLAQQLKNTHPWKLQNFNPTNALDVSYRASTAWDLEYFADLSRRASQVHAGAA